MTAFKSPFRPAFNPVAGNVAKSPRKELESLVPKKQMVDMRAFDNAAGKIKSRLIHGYYKKNGKFVEGYKRSGR